MGHRVKRTEAELDLGPIFLLSTLEPVHRLHRKGQKNLVALECCVTMFRILNALKEVAFPQLCHCHLVYEAPNSGEVMEKLDF